jgi:signal transduction histidine kinase
MDEIQALALAFWHRGFTPDSRRVMQLEPQSRAIAGYLIDFFSQFNCLTDEQGQLLANIAAELRTSLGTVSVTSDNADDTAGRWGLAVNIYPFMRYILNFQTRHYIPPPEELA